MRHLTLSGSSVLRRETCGFGECTRSDPLTFRSMDDASVHLCDDKVRHNADARWEDFSSEEYWLRNYEKMQPEDQEIIHRVSSFFRKAFCGRGRVQRAIDVGSGTNLYPALLMLPWTEQILYIDHSASNVRWLRCHVTDDRSPWVWQPFWREIRDSEGYNRISDPRAQLRQACSGNSEYAGIEQRSVFDLPSARWQLGTMFFVAESITEERREFCAAIDAFVGALQPESPFAATFMAGSYGYIVGKIRYPALPITSDDVVEQFKRLGVGELSVDLLQTSDRVREGYAGMIIATGIVGS
jgi:NNMT/PNMT/TEMT family